jgi:PAS domain S-box-containing protein
MVMTDCAGTIVLVNTETERMFGYHRDELIGQPTEVLLPQRLRDRHLRHRARFADHPQARPVEARRGLFGLRRDGREFPVEIGLNPIHTREGLFVLSVIVDISDRKRMDQLKDEFVSTVSHELRTPLTSIAASLDLLVGGAAGKLPEAALRLLTIAQTNSQRLVRLSNDILDIEKIESGQIVFNFRPVDALVLVEQAIEANRGYADRFGVRVRLDSTSTPAEVQVDADRLSQVVTNLLSNAIKFSPRGGEVTIAVDRHADVVRISVRDHGHGIPAEFKPHIFEKFAQADATDARLKGGTGLGLSIVKQLVGRLGGEVGFADAEGGGTVFYVELPCRVRVSGRPRILHVDDDRDVLDRVAHTLDSIADVVSVDSIDEARCALATAQFDLAVVDVDLGGVSGLDLLPELRDSKGAPIPVIIFSACAIELEADLPVEASLSKSRASLDNLVVAVRDRLLARSLPIREEVT